MLRTLTRILGWLLGGWLLLAGPVARAQPLEQQPDRVLSTVGIRDLSSDPAGFTWVAARQGMFRYDGRQLVPLNQLVRQGPRLHGEAIRVASDSAGTVWWACTTGCTLSCPLPASCARCRCRRLRAGTATSTPCCCSGGRCGLARTEGAGRAGLVAGVPAAAAAGPGSPRGWCGSARRAG